MIVFQNGRTLVMSKYRQEELREQMREGEKLGERERRGRGRGRRRGREIEGQGRRQKAIGARREQSERLIRYGRECCPQRS